MIRQTSLKNTKVVSREKIVPSVLLIVKTDGSSSQRESAGKSREKKEERGSKEGKRESAGKGRLKQERSSVQTEAVLMKKELKMLMNRNNPIRIKPAAPLPSTTKQPLKELSKTTKPVLPAKKELKSKEAKESKESKESKECKPRSKPDKPKLSSKRCSHQETLQPTAISITRNTPTNPSDTDRQPPPTQRPSRRSLDPTSNPVGVRRAQIE